MNRTFKFLETSLQAHHFTRYPNPIVEIAEMFYVTGANNKAAPAPESTQVRVAKHVPSSMTRVERQQQDTYIEFYRDKTLRSAWLLHSP